MTNLKISNKEEMEDFLHSFKNEWLLTEEDIDDLINSYVQCREKFSKEQIKDRLDTYLKDRIEEENRYNPDDEAIGLNAEEILVTDGKEKATIWMTYMYDFNNFGWKTIEQIIDVDTLEDIMKVKGGECAWK